MKSVILWVLSLILILSANAQYNLSNPDVLISSDIKNIDFLHVKTKFDNDTTKVRIGETIGKIDQQPEILSKSFDSEIKRSYQFYRNGHFEQAYTVLETAIMLEPSNPFVMEAYARALYQTKDKKDKSFEVYKKLITMLDSTNNNSSANLAIDMWFREAYWKLGTLYMDRKDWKKAQYEINRFLASIQELTGTVVYSQALEYLTECYFEMGDNKLCKHFAERTLFYVPDNQYAKSCLKQLQNEGLN